MSYEFQFPDVGEGIHEGRLVEWLMNEGDKVDEDQPIARVETDKAVVEIPSPKAGTVLSLKCAEGDTIAVGDVIVVFGDAGETVKSAAKLEPKAASVAGLKVASADKKFDPAAVATRPLATPHTRAHARKLGVDLTEVQGTGKNGRITDEDVDRSSAGTDVPPAKATAAPSSSSAPVGRRDQSGLEQRVPLTHLRKVIAEAMSHSQKTSAHVTHVDEVDVTDILALQKRMRSLSEEQGGPRMTLMPLFVRAVVSVLRDYPIFNSTFDEQSQEIVFKKYFNIGMAVDTSEGLIVPVIKSADQKNLFELSTEIKDLATRARDRQLAIDELQGGTCTVTNIGPVGGLFATPIIRQPEMAIVAFHAIKKRPVVMGDEIVARDMMYMSVAFDHRFVDGADAARFMNDLVALIKNPELLMARM